MRMQDIKKNQLCFTMDCSLRLCEKSHIYMYLYNVKICVIFSSELEVQTHFTSEALQSVHFCDARKKNQRQNERNCKLLIVCVIKFPIKPSTTV